MSKERVVLTKRGRGIKVITEVERDRVCDWEEQDPCACEGSISYASSVKTPAGTVHKIIAGPTILCARHRKELIDGLAEQDPE